MIGVLGIALSLSLLMWLAYRGVSVLLIAPPLALLAVLAGGDTRVLATYTQIFMTGLGGFVAKYFPLFLLGAVFGRLVNDSGSAESIARAIATRFGDRRALLAVVLATAVLTYGGVSVFVVAFTVYPVAAALFRRADVPKRLIPGAIGLGSATFTMTALPGAPTIQNAIPMPYFGTDLYAAPILGTIAGVLMFALGMIWLERRARKAERAAEGYGRHPADPAPAASAGALPPVWSAALPLVLVIAGNYLLTRVVIPSMDTAYLADARFGKVGLSDVLGLWALISALSLGLVAVLAFHWSRLDDARGSLNQGALGSLLPVFNTATEVGYGTVVASLAGFAVVRDAVLNAFPSQPLVSEALAVNILAGITGSASGGLSIALAAMGSTFLSAGVAAGVDPAVLHRVASLASGGLDSLPHNGAVITILVICHLTHRESYLDIFAVTVAVPILTLAAVIGGGMGLGLF